jgi:hypothetical protein
MSLYQFYKQLPISFISGWLSVTQVVTYQLPKWLPTSYPSGYLSVTQVVTYPVTQVVAY